MLEKYIYNQKAYPQIFDKFNNLVDNTITGGTYNNNILSLFLFNNNSINISGFTNTNIYTTGGTYNNNEIQFKYNDDNGYVVTGITGTYTTGGTYNNGYVVFTDNNGDNFILDLTSISGDTNTFITGGTYNNDLLILSRNDNENILISGITNTFITGGTYDNGTLQLLDNKGSNIIINGFLTNYINNTSYNFSTWSGDTVSGATRQALANKFNTIDNNINSLSTYTLSLSATTQNLLNTKLNVSDFNIYSASTLNSITGNTSSIQQLSSTTQNLLNTKLNISDFNVYSASTLNKIDSKVNNTLFNTYTGNTESELNNIKNNINTLSGKTDVFVTGGTLNGSILTLSNNTGGTFNISGFISSVNISNLPYNFSTWSGDTVSGATRQALANKFSTIDNNNNILSAYTQSLSATTQNLLNTKLNISDFNVYSGNTQSQLNGLSGKTDVYVSGMTFNNSNYILTINRTDGVSLNQNLSILSSDVTITGGTYNSSNGSVLFVNNTGGTFTVTGFLTGVTDTYLTGGTFNGSTLTLNNNIGSPIIIGGFTTGGTGTNTLSNQVYNYSTWSGDTVSGATRQAIANKFNSVDTNINSLSAYTLSLSSTTQNQLNLKVDTSLFNSYTGSTQNQLNGLSAYTQSLSSTTQNQLNLKLNINDFNSYSASTFDKYVSGGTFTSSANTLTLRRSDNINVVITGITDNNKLDITAFNSYSGNTNNQLTGITTNINTISAYTLSLSSTTQNLLNLKLNISDFNVYTGNTNNILTGNTLNIQQLSAYTLSLSSTTQNQLNLKVDNSLFNIYTGNTQTLINSKVDTYVTGGTYNNGSTIFRNNTGGTFSVTGYTTSNISNDIYSFSTWSGDTVSGATRQSLSNKFNIIDSNISTLSAYTQSLSSTTQNLLNNKISQSGNTFGTNVLIGSNDNFGLQLETNGIVRQTIANDGLVTFEGTTGNTGVVRMRQLQILDFDGVTWRNGIKAAVSTNQFEIGNSTSISYMQAIYPYNALGQLGTTSRAYNLYTNDIRITTSNGYKLTTYVGNEFNANTQQYYGVVLTSNDFANSATNATDFMVSFNTGATNTFKGNFYLQTGLAKQSNIGQLNLYHANGVAPTGNPTSGFFMYGNAGNPEFRTSSGDTIVLKKISAVTNLAGLSAQQTALGFLVTSTIKVDISEINTTGTPSISTFLRGDGTWSTTSSGGVSDGDKGDITVSSGGTVWTIDNNVVTIPKISATGTPSISTFLRGDGVWATPAGGSGFTCVTATLDSTFGSEDNVVITTITSSTITTTNFRSFTAVPINTTDTSLDDFTLNGVSFNVENIINNTSFDIRASSINGATGTYRITYYLNYQ